MLSDGVSKQKTERLTSYGTAFGLCMPGLCHTLLCTSTHWYTQCTNSITLLISHSAPSFYPFVALHPSQCFAPRLIAKVTASTQLPPRHPGKVREHKHIHTQSPTQIVHLFLCICIFYSRTQRSLPNHSQIDKLWNKNSFVMTRLTQWGHNCVGQIISSQSEYFFLQLCSSPHKIESCFSISRRQLEPELFPF